MGVLPSAPRDDPYGAAERRGGSTLVLERNDRPSLRDLERWDHLVEAAAGSDVTQSSVWARVRELEGFGPRYLFVRSGSRLVGGAQVLVRRIGGFGHVAYCPYGPIVSGGEPDVDEAAALLAGGLAGLSRIGLLVVQPPEDGEFVRQALLTRGFRPSSVDIAPAGSVRLDLRAALDDIRGGLPPRLRSWTRRWPGHGVTVRRGSAADVPTLAALMRAAAQSQGYHRPPGEHYLGHLYRELDAAGRVALFVGEVHGIPVTADLVTMFGTTVRGRFCGFDRRGEAGRLSVPAAARWTIIRWAKAAGYEWLDFGGLGEHALADRLDRGVRSDPSWPGPDRAKLQFGGTAFRYPGAVERIAPALLRATYDTVSRRSWGAVGLHRAALALRSSARRATVTRAGG